MRQRKIKFKVWSGSMFLDGGDANIQVVDRDDTTIKIVARVPHKDYILCQFTGLLDKNGKEIYEGDIVKGLVCFPQLLDWDSAENSNFEMGGVVAYDHTQFRLEVIQKMCSEDREGMVNYFDFIGSSGETFSKIEVIGNIYESPELLNQ